MLTRTRPRHEDLPLTRGNKCKSPMQFLLSTPNSSHLTVVREVPCRSLITWARSAAIFHLELVERNATNRQQYQPPFSCETCKSVVDHSAAVTKKMGGKYYIITPSTKPGTENMI